MTTLILVGLGNRMQNIVLRRTSNTIRIVRQIISVTGRLGVYGS